MDCVVCAVGDSHHFSVIHFMYRVMALSNAEVDASILSSGTWARYHFRKIHQSSGNTTICCNYAMSGTSLSSIVEPSTADQIAWLPRLNALADDQGAGRRHILYVAFGGNKGPGTAAEFIAMMESFIASQHAAGWDDIILQTIASRTDATWGAAGQSNESYAKVINDQYLDTGWQATHNVTISDIASVAEIGPWDRGLDALAVPSNNAANFYDTVHPTRATVELARPIIRAAINARITAAGGAILALAEDP